MLIVYNERAICMLFSFIVEALAWKNKNSCKQISPADFFEKTFHRSKKPYRRVTAPVEKRCLSSDEEFF